jgi:hypothetical protein
MNVRFTRHAVEKFERLKRHGVMISKSKVIQIVLQPDMIDYRKSPLLIAQSELDKRHVLRVVYREEGNMRVVITFYPGRKSQYETHQ